jgi:TRAP transporter TAXI family solute receptor
MKKIGTFLVLLMFIFVGSSVSEAQAPKALSFGTSSMGSAFYTLSVVISNVITKHGGISVTVEPVGGSDATLRGIGAKKVEIGMVNANSAVDALAGAGSYSKVGKIPISLIAQGQDSLRQIVVRADSGIKTPKDFPGKKLIARRKANQEIEVIANLLFDLYGVDKKEVKILETAESNEAVEALKMGTVDAAILPGGVPASFLLDLAQSTKVVFLSIPDDKLSTMLKRLGPAFHRGIIPPNTYRGQNYEVRVPAMSSLIVCRSDLPEETVYKITKSIFENYEEIKAGHSAGKDWNLQNTLKAPPLPFHPGAVRYFKEAGVWSK